MLLNLLTNKQLINYSNTNCEMWVLLTVHDESDNTGHSPRAAKWVIWHLTAVLALIPDHNIPDSDDREVGRQYELISAAIGTTAVKNQVLLILVGPQSDTSHID